MMMRRKRKRRSWKRPSVVFLDDAAARTGVNVESGGEREREGTAGERCGRWQGGMF
jgi:hypothetical protein